MILPRWIERMPKGDERNCAVNRFAIRLAALYATPSGQIKELAYLIGVEPKTLHNQALSRIRATRPTRDGIRALLGNDFVPPELPVLPRR